MSDKSDILDELSELVDMATDLSDRVDAIRDKVDGDSLRVPSEFADEIIFDLEGDDTGNAYDAETEATENAAWSEGWQACIDRIRQDYGS